MSGLWENDLEGKKRYYYILDNSCNKYCDFIGWEEVTIRDDFDSHLQLYALKCSQ